MTNVARALCAAGLGGVIVVFAYDAVAVRVRRIPDRWRAARARRAALSETDPKLAAAIRQVGAGRWGG